MKEVHYKIRLTSSLTTVFTMLNTDSGRAAFWADLAFEKDGAIHFEFSNGFKMECKILRITEPRFFEIVYFGTMLRITLFEEKGATILELHNSEIPDEEFVDMHAGWVSVLLALKAACDFGIDLRNHNHHYSWDQGFVDN